MPPKELRQWRPSRSWKSPFREARKGDQVQVVPVAHEEQFFPRPGFPKGLEDGKEE